MRTSHSKLSWWPSGAAGLCAALVAACSSSGTSGGGADGGGPPVATGPGTFSSVWQAASVEVLVIDSSNPVAHEQKTIEVPAVVKEPTSGANVELYVTFEKDLRVTYGHYAGANVYYRITQEAGHFGEGESEQYTMENAIYTLEDGRLTMMTPREADTKAIIATTTFRKIDTFPPAGWPTEKIDYEAGDVQ